ncbi:MAG TPA: cation transporter [Propionibacteriaceae bacterium]
MTTAAISTSGRLDGDRRGVLQRRVRLVVAAIIGYNLIEAIIAITAGSIASSTALISFGLDSCVEVLSAAAIAWQFSAADPEKREKVALRTVAFAFFALAAYVTVDSVRNLLGSTEPAHSTVGIVLAATSLVVMPFLSWFERRTGRELGSASVVADSKQTLLCTYLSGVLLVGLVLNSTLGWSWADPIAALVIAGVAVKEGVEAWRGDTCCTPPSGLLAGQDTEDLDDCCGEGGCSDGCCTPSPGARADSAGPQSIVLTVTSQRDTASMESRDRR